MSEEATATPTGSPSSGEGATMMIDAPPVVVTTTTPIDSAPPEAPAPDPEIDKVAKPEAEDGGRAGEIEALKAQIDALKSAQEGSAEQLTRHAQAMRETLLGKLGVMDKFKGYAPDVDPFTDDGRAKLESWAAENPELLEARPASAPAIDVEALKKSVKSPHLVDLNSYIKSIKGL